MSYRNDYREFQREAFWTLPRLALLGAACIMVIASLSLVTTPLGLLQKTFNPDNIITNYEWFHDANQQVDARVAQIKGHRSILNSTTVEVERNRLNIELAAIQQACRDLTAKYNANSTKTNRAIFKGQTAPETLDPQVCE